MQSLFGGAGLEVSVGPGQQQDVETPRDPAKSAWPKAAPRQLPAVACHARSMSAMARCVKRR